MRFPFATGGSHTNARRRLSHLAPALIATAVAGSGLLSPAPAGADASAKALECHASVSNAHPSDGSTTIVHVETVAKARVTTSARYRTTTNTKLTKANEHGSASTSYNVSDATKGFRVIVTVRVHRANRSGACRTSYMPQ
jgi:hypothetical protein